MNTLLKVLGTLVIAALVALYRLFIFLKVYSLTMIPLGAPHLTLFQALGVSVAVSVLTYDATSQHSNENILTKVISQVIGLSIILLLAMVIF